MLSEIFNKKDASDGRSFQREFSFRNYPFNVILGFCYRNKDGASTLGLSRVTVKKTDQKYSPATESKILFDLKDALNIIIAEHYGVFGFTAPVIKPFIKKLMWKDGHMVDDTCQYIRTSGKPQKDMPYYGIWDGDYAIRLSTEKLKENGEVSFSVESLGLED